MDPMVMSGLFRRKLSPGSMLALVLCLALLCVSSAAREFSTGSHQSVSVPYFERLGPLDTLVGWQLPNGPVKKVFVVLESVNVVPTDYWMRSEYCPDCRGLPENVKIISDALLRGYAVFVPMSITPPIGDWESWPMDNVEIRNLFLIFSEWKQARGLEVVPNVCLGTSAGGHLVSTLGLYTGLFESIAIMISHGTAEAFEAVKGPEYPPTLFVHMPKDYETAALVTERRNGLSALGVLTEECQWKEHPLSPKWFADAIPGMPSAMSSAIYERLKQEGWLNEENYLIADSDNWTTILRAWNILPNDTIVQDKLMYQDSISQELNVAYAFHVTLARLDEKVFDWFGGGYSFLGYSASF